MVCTRKSPRVAVMICASWLTRKHRQTDFNRLYY